MSAILNDDVTAEAAWLAVEDGTTYLVMDLDDGQTIDVELTSPAMHKIADDIRHGPTEVRS